MAWLVFAAILLAGVTIDARSEVELYPAGPHSVPSEGYQVTVDGHQVFTEKFKGVHCARFSFSGVVVVAIRGAGSVGRFEISPRSAGIVAAVADGALTFKLDRPRQLVVTLNGGERLFLFADAIDRDAPVPGRSGVKSVVEFGADPTGRQLNTDCLQRAIDQVAAAHGTLFFPPGVYLTGTLSLKSDLTLYLAGGAVLLGSTRAEDYPIEGSDRATKQALDAQGWRNQDGVDVASASTVAFQRLILLDQVRNVRVLGRGTIDGQGKRARTKTCRPQLVHIRDSSQVLFEGVALRDPAFFNTNILRSDHVTYRNVKLLNDPTVPNTDGFDPDGSQDILADSCFISSGDDAIAIKSSDQGPRTRSAERITVRNCVLLTGTTAMKLGSESFAEYTRDVTFEHNDVVQADRAINLSCRDGARYENLRFIDIRVERLVFKSEQRIFVMQVRPRVPGGKAGWIHEVLIEDFSVAEECPHPSRLAGLSAEHDLRGIRFMNYSIAGKVRRNAADAGVEMNEFVHDVTFQP